MANFNIFGNTAVKKSVDSVLTAFRTAIDDLNTVATEQEAEAQRQADIATQAALDKAAAEAEAARAKAIAAQMTAVFN